MEGMYDVIIIGSGPAGLAAGLYTSRAKLNTLIIERETIGGELMNRQSIENYPGYPDGIIGPELGSNMLTQVTNYGTNIEFGEVEKIQKDGDFIIVRASMAEYRAKGVIISGGAHPKKLGVPGEEQFTDQGVFYCATCDGPRYADKVVAVAGGGDSGVTEALFLAQMVSRVIIIEMMPELMATKILQDRVAADPKIEVRCGTRIEAIHGKEEVDGIDIFDVLSKKKSSLVVDGVLVHIGIEPNTEYLKGTVSLDQKGQVVVNEWMETEVPGIFAAGDIRSNSPCQISTAVGDGATAAISMQRFLSKR
ncbi:NAD(P)/FAD-dependent oxidoreductase [Chloroflexota bacterium]